MVDFSFLVLTYNPQLLEESRILRSFCVKNASSSELKLLIRGVIFKRFIDWTLFFNIGLCGKHFNLTFPM